MSIIKDLKIKISGDKASLSENVYIYEHDRGVELRLKLNLIKTNHRPIMLSSMFKANRVFAGTTILKPNGILLYRDKVEVIDNIISFIIDHDLTDEFDEIGIYKLQFHLYDEEDSRITIPPIEFEVKELLKGTNNEGIVDTSKTDFCVVADDKKTMEIFSNGKYIKTIWNSGDLITSAKLNKIEEAIEVLNDKLENALPGDGLLSSEMVQYSTANDENITSVKDALDKLLYTNLTISLNANVPTTLEKGRVVDEVVFNWNYNKKVVSQSFNGESLGKDVRSYTYNTSFDTNKTFVLSANDGTNNFNKNISFNFLNGRYWGVSNSNTYDSNFIKSLSKELASSRGKTFTVNCESGQHIFYCIPSSFGTPTFTVGGFSGGFNKIQTIQFTNASGFTESYDIWKSTNSNLGNTTVAVS